MIDIEMDDEQREKLLQENERRVLHDSILRAGLLLTDENVSKMRAFLEGKPVVLSSGLGPVAVDVVTQRGAEDLQFVNPAQKGANERPA